MHDGENRKKAADFQVWLETADPFSIVFSSLNERDFFRRAMDREKRVGRLRPVSVGIASEALYAGKKSFDRMILQFKLSGRNDEALLSTDVWKVVGVEGSSATFEAENLEAQPGDRLQIDAEVGQGEERTCFRILGTVVECSGVNSVTVSFDELNRARLQMTLQKVAKRLQELKDFFKNAKGA